MKCAHHPLLIAALVVAFAGAAHAQPGSSKAPAIDCKALSAMPNAPMSFEQCEQYQALAADMQQNRTGGERPGDEQMTCEQIIAELSPFSVPAATLESAKESVAAGQNLKSTYDAAMAEAKAAAPVRAATAAAGVVVSVLPGGNAAASAAAEAQIAQQAAIANRHKPKLDAAMDRATSANGATAAGATTMMRANPRMARLAHLVEVRNCSASGAPR